MSRMKKILATVVTSVLLLGMMASPAFAGSHHHVETLSDIHQAIHHTIPQPIHQLLPIV